MQKLFYKFKAPDAYIEQKQTVTHQVLECKK
jgi:hypothetical protein